MEDSIRLSESGDYIILTVRGDINRVTAMQQIQEAHALGREKGLNRYFMDMTESRNTDSVSDQYEFANKDMQQAEDIDKSARVAALVAKGDHSHDFIETVLLNAGLNLRLFTDTESALAYLFADSASGKPLDTDG